MKRSDPVQFVLENNYHDGNEVFFFFIAALNTIEVSVNYVCLEITDQYFNNYTGCREHSSINELNLARILTDHAINVS